MPAPRPLPRRPGRVLVLSTDPGIPLYGPSGSSAHLRGVIRALGELGWAVTAAVPRLEDHRGAVDDPLDVPVVTAAPRRWGWIPRRWRERGERWDARRLLRRALGREQPDLIWERHALFSPFPHDTGIPRLVELNAPLALERSLYGTLSNPAWAQRVEGEALRSADQVIAVSDWLAKWAVAAAGVDPLRLRHVPNGVTPRPPGDRATTRARLDLQGLVIGFLGTLKPWHGIDRLPAILDALPEATALVVGDGPVAVPEHPRILAVGRAAPDAVPDLVAAMDVGLAPYPAEAPAWFCPLKVLEYRAQGVPVVAADVGDCRHLLAEGGGEVVQGDAPAAWAEAVRRQARRPRIPDLRPWTRVVREALAPRAAP